MSSRRRSASGRAEEKMAKIPHIVSKIDVSQKKSLLKPKMGKELDKFARDDFTFDPCKGTLHQRQCSNCNGV